MKSKIPCFENSMKIKYDKTIDAKYIRVKKGKIASTKKEKLWLLFDYNKDNEVLGVEILNASKHPISFSVINNSLPV